MRESNRFKHCLVGFFLASWFGIGAAFSAGIAAEYKDWCYAGQKGGIFGFFKKGSGFDWLDLAATMIGGIIGSLFHYLVLGHVHL